MSDSNDPYMQARVKALEEALRAYAPETDRIGQYDPLLSAVHFAPRPRPTGGYNVWPEDGPDPAETLRILSYGNSTAMWPAANWSELFAEALAAEGRPLTLFHGAGKGNTSSQEVLRVLRDAPAIKPHLIVSLSGICDVGHLQSSPQQPFMHKYIARVMRFLKKTDVVSNVVWGYPESPHPAQIWCRNQRFARTLADEMGIKMLVFLQPVQGFGRYEQSQEEADFFAQKAKVELRGYNMTYVEAVKDFYENVFAIMAERPEAYDHVVNFTDVFADCPGAYRDHRHQNAKGVAHLAERMLPHIRSKLPSEPAQP